MSSVDSVPPTDDALDQVPPTPQEDIDLFATGLYRSRGMAARHLALKRARTLLDVGDLEGHRVWRAVADRVNRFRDADPS
jgi:hypothetical protein